MVVMDSFQAQRQALMRRWPGFWTEAKTRMQHCTPHVGDHTCQHGTFPLSAKHVMTGMSPTRSRKQHMASLGLAGEGSWETTGCKLEAQPESADSARKRAAISYTKSHTRHHRLPGAAAAPKAQWLKVIKV